MAKRLVDHTDEELLAELLRRHKPTPGPSKVVFASNSMVTTVGIGADEAAAIYVFKEGIEQLEKIVGRRPL